MGAVEEVHGTKHLETLEEYYPRMSTEVQNWTRRKNKRSCPPPSPPSSVSAEEAYEDDNGSAMFRHTVEANTQRNITVSKYSPHTENSGTRTQKIISDIFISHAPQLSITQRSAAVLHEYHEFPAVSIPDGSM